MKPNLEQLQQEMRDRQLEEKAEVAKLAKLNIPNNITQRYADLATRQLCSICNRRVCRKGSTFCSRCTGKAALAQNRDTLPGVEVEKPRVLYVAPDFDAPMKLTVDEEWLRRKAIEEDGCDVSAGRLEPGVEKQTVIEKWFRKDTRTGVVSEDGNVVLREKIASDLEPQIDALPEGNYYTRRQVAQMCGVSVTSICRWERKGKIPAPKKLVHNNQLLYTDEHVQLIKDYKSQQAEIIYQPSTPKSAQEEAAKDITKKAFTVNKKLERAVSSSLGNFSIGKLGKLV